MAAIRHSVRACLILVAGLHALGLLAGCSANDPESPQAKREWAVLQGVESSSRSVPIAKPEFLQEQGYELMSLPARSGERIWIMLKPVSSPYYKQMPAVQYDVPKSVVDTLVREQRVSETAAHVLRSHQE